jgi:hypothetical protein
MVHPGHSIVEDQDTISFGEMIRTPSRGGSDGMQLCLFDTNDMGGINARQSNLSRPRQETG